MSIFDKLFHRTPKAAKWAMMLNGWSPTFGQYGTNAYQFDVVQQALKCIVDEMKKLNPQHIRMNGTEPVPIMDSTIQKVLEEPNPIMTTSEFLEKTFWLLLLNYNAFIYPVYDSWTDRQTGAERRYYRALYPLQPERVDFLEDAGGRLFVKFWFRNGQDTTLPYDDVIHLKYNYSINTYMGGDEFGQPDQAALVRTLNLNEELLHGVAKAMKASYAVNGVIKYNTLLDDGSMATAIKEMENNLKRSESGILPIDMKSEYTPLEHKSEIVDENTLKFVDEKILRYWGVPVDMLLGDYTQETYNSFYQKALEPLIVSASQAFTKKVFTSREKAYGNKIELYPKDLIFMSVDQTLAMVNELAPTGAMFENEKRAAFGLKPLPELEGKRYMSLNWIDANNAAQYQVGLDNANIDIVDETKEDI